MEEAATREAEIAEKKKMRAEEEGNGGKSGGEDKKGARRKRRERKKRTGVEGEDGEKRERKPRTPRPEKNVTLVPMGGTKVGDRGHYQIEAYLSPLLGSREASSFDYSADNGGQVVDQGIAFNAASRESEAGDVVNDMRKRNQNRANRADKQTAGDKKNNPLIALPGSLGSGKSTFVVHFPVSATYKQYFKDTNRPAAIVSTLTFNSGMDSKRPKKNDVGLRIIFGCMRAMLGLELFPMTWEAFLKKFKAQNIPASDAVEMLRRLFGSDRPVLLLVDELSKAVNDKEVMEELGVVLNKDGNCDVVVTSLSPAYVFDLLTGSQRPITYVPMAPLLSTTAGLVIGAIESNRWANRVNVTAGGILN